MGVFVLVAEGAIWRTVFTIEVLENAAGENFDVLQEISGEAIVVNIERL